MAVQNVVVGGKSYTGINEVNLQKVGGGTVRFIETSDANASASDIAQGKKAYVNGDLVTGTNSGGSGFTPFFAADIFETKFTLDSNITGVYEVQHTLGVSPNIIELYATSGQTVGQECFTGGFVCILNPVPDQVAKTVRDSYYYTPANDDTSNQTKIPGGTHYIGTGPSGTVVKIYGTAEYPLLAGVEYNVRMYVFK